VHAHLGMMPARKKIIRRMRDEVARVWGQDQRFPALDVPAGNLNVADQQLVLIVKALLEDASILVFDEPTAALSLAEAERFLTTVERLRDHGRAILYVTHRLEDVFRIADRATILRDGRVVAEQRVADSDPQQLVTLITGSSLGEMPSVDERRERTDSAVTLRVQGLSGGSLKHASFTATGGRILGVAGLVGSGRSTLARILAGAQEAATGDLWLNDQKLQFRQISDAVRHGVVLVPEDRREEGLFQGLTVGSNIAIPQLQKFSGRTKVFLSRRREQRFTADCVRRFGIKPNRSQVKIEYLSGGNQQKVLVARWLSMNPEVAILDEPTQGIDVGVRFEIFQQLRMMSQQGVCVIIISADFEDLIELADDIAIVVRGRLDNVIKMEGQVTKERLLNMCYGYGIEATGNIHHGSKASPAMPSGGPAHDER
jgi:ABC-type sugar transport system ATPase subunit